MKSNPVLVVGAGPVGLSAALALAQAGTPLRIIDKLPQPINQSRAAIIHARTLEHFNRLDIIDDFLAVGVKVHGAAIYGPGGTLLVRPSFDHIPSPFPFLLGLEQFKTEELLTARLRALGVGIDRGVELTAFSDESDYVTAHFRHPDGSETSAHYAYLIGADGGRSAVRAGLGLQLEGETLDATWITADVKIRWDRDPSEMIAYLSDVGIAFIAAMNDDRWRVILNLPDATREQAEKFTVPDIQKAVCERFGLQVEFYDPVWVSVFGINTRMAPAMSRGRVFLAGDAAHVHSPVGGQGMNTGIQDALNLAWKINLVVKGLAKPELLDSYNAERHYNAKRLLSRVGKATKMANLRQPVAIGIRNHVIQILGHLGITKVMPQIASMLDVGYPESPAVSESHISWLNRGPRAGERAPDALGLLAPGSAAPRNLFDLWRGDDRHQLLIFGDETPFPESPPLYAITRFVREGTPAPGLVVDSEGDAYEAYGVSSPGACYLVRPDGIVAFRSGEPDRAALSEYLAEWYPAASPAASAPSATQPPAVLVTGASSGIGLATARLLSESGYLVFAGVRRLSPESASSKNSSWQEILLDVSDPESIATATREIEARVGVAGIAAIVNNAGIAEVSPLEFTPLEKFRRVFDVNVFGVVAVTQAFLPLLHRGHGRIVNIGSVGGMISIPFGASLCASKHAIEAISDCLRLELYPSGIHVTCIQPASINSGSAEKLAAHSEEVIASLPPEGRDRYAGLLRHFMQVTLDSETKGSSPCVVADAVLEVLRAEHPPARRLVGKDSILLKFAARGVPDSLRDPLLRKVFFGSSSFGSSPARLP